MEESIPAAPVSSLISGARGVSVSRDPRFPFLDADLVTELDMGLGVTGGVRQRGRGSDPGACAGGSQGEFHGDARDGITVGVRHLHDHGRGERLSYRPALTVPLHHLYVGRTLPAIRKGEVPTPAGGDQAGNGQRVRQEEPERRRNVGGGQRSSLQGGARDSLAQNYRLR